MSLMSTYILSAFTVSMKAGHTTAISASLLEDLYWLLPPALFQQDRHSGNLCSRNEFSENNLSKLASKCLSPFRQQNNQAAVTRNWVDFWTTEIYFSLFWRLGSPRSWCQKILSDEDLLPHRWSSSRCIHLVEGMSDELSWTSKGPKPIHDGSSLITNLPSKGPTITFRVRISTYGCGGHTFILWH